MPSHPELARKRAKLKRARARAEAEPEKILRRAAKELKEGQRREAVLVARDQRHTEAEQVKRAGKAAREEVGRQAQVEAEKKADAASKKKKEKEEEKKKKKGGARVLAAALSKKSPTPPPSPPSAPIRVVRLIVERCEVDLHPIPLRETVPRFLALPAVTRVYSDFVLEPLLKLPGLAPVGGVGGVGVNSHPYALKPDGLLRRVLPSLSLSSADTPANAYLLEQKCSETGFDVSCRQLYIKYRYYRAPLDRVVVLCVRYRKVLSTQEAPGSTYNEVLSRRLVKLSEFPHNGDFRDPPRYLVTQPELLDEYWKAFFSPVPGELRLPIEF